MKSLSQIIEELKISQNQDSIDRRFDLVNNLTEEEREYHISYEIGQRKKAYAYRMRDMGALPEQIEFKLATKDFSLTAEEEREVLHNAALRKQWAMEAEFEKNKARIAEQNRIAQLKKQWNAEAFMQMIRLHYKSIHGEMQIIPGQNEFFKAIAYFLSGDDRLETEMNFKKDRGLIIYGDPGMGKTETFNAVKNNPLNPVRLFSILEIAEQVKEKGCCEFALDMFTVIDDVGSESVPVKYYGTEINWFKDFIEIMHLKKRYSKLIITTNCGGDEFEKLYGYRVRSRIREMFNVINLKGKDLRQ